MRFVSIKYTKRAGMTNTILHQLQDMPLLAKNIRGQGYTNGRLLPNMKGKKTEYKNEYWTPGALFVPCRAHSLNVVVNDVGKCCLKATAFFNLIHHVYVYFNYSFDTPLGGFKTLCTKYDSETIERHKLRNSY